MRKVSIERPETDEELRQRAEIVYPFRESALSTMSGSALDSWVSAYVGIERRRVLVASAQTVPPIKGPIETDGKEAAMRIVSLDVLRHACRAAGIDHERARAVWQPIGSPLLVQLQGGAMDECDQLARRLCELGAGPVFVNKGP
jgi:hypothetical protein